MAYNKVFAPHHSWAIRKAVSAGLFVLPSKSQLLKKLNDDGVFFSTSLLVTISYALSLVLIAESVCERNLNVMDFLLICLNLKLWSFVVVSTFFCFIMETTTAPNPLFQFPVRNSSI